MTQSSYSSFDNNKPVVRADADCVVPVDAGVCSTVVATIEEVATGEVPAVGWDSTAK